MALFQCYYPSDVMNKFMAMNVILPDSEDGRLDEVGKYPVVYLLHGYTDDYSKWLRMTSIERYAEEHKVAIVMPDAGKSFYTDMDSGDPYFTYITEEVPKYVQKWFPISKDPEYNYVVGLSMGGYGAMKIAFTYPERFKAAATFSGALALAQIATTKLPEDAEPWLKRLEVDMQYIFGDVNNIANSSNDLFWLLPQLKMSGKKIPNLYVSSGTDDFIHPNTQGFCQLLDGLEIPYEYHEEAETHNWGFWDREIISFLKWIEQL